MKSKYLELIHIKRCFKTTNSINSKVVWNYWAHWKRKRIIGSPVLDVLSEGFQSSTKKFSNPSKLVLWAVGPVIIFKWGSQSIAPFTSQCSGCNPLTTKDNSYGPCVFRQSCSKGPSASHPIQLAHALTLRPILSPLRSIGSHGVLLIRSHPSMHLSTRRLTWR